MKTGITVIKTRQISMDEFQDIRVTKVWDDNATIKEIKNWIYDNSNKNVDSAKDIGLVDCFISNIQE